MKVIRSALGLDLELLKLNSIAFHLPPQSGSANLEVIGRFGSISSVAAQGRPNGLGLTLRQGRDA